MRQSLLGARALSAALVAFGCASSSPATEDRGISPDAANEVRGEIGSHVWYPSSASVTLEESWYFSSRGTGNPAESGSESESYARSELSAGALARLSGLKLVPLEDGCTADGYRYHVLTVADADGTSAAYADMGCHYLQPEGTTVMLDSLAVDGLMLAGE